MQKKSPISGIKMCSPYVCEKHGSIVIKICKFQPRYATLWQLNHTWPQNISFDVEKLAWNKAICRVKKSFDQNIHI